jgi:MFS family permease
LSSLLFQRLNLTISSEILSFFFSSLAVLSTLLLLTKNIFAAMLTMSIIGFQGGMMEPMYYNEAMKNVPRRIKATVLSVTSFIFHIPAIVSAIIGSIFIDFFDADDSFRYFFYISIVIFFVSALAFIKYRKNKE